MSKRKISVVLVDRANYGRLKPVLHALKQHPDLELQLVCTGTMVLERFGAPVNVVKEDGFTVDSEIYIELEGSVPATMAKSLGFAVIEFASEFQRLKPDIVLIIGDRYEAFAAGIAAAYMNICTAHIQGGEVSGSIDESARHCLTKLAQYHFPATKRAADYIERMGERKDTVFHVGCPGGDIALGLDKKLPRRVFERGIGGPIDPAKPYMLVIVHPITTEFGMERDETERLIQAMAKLNHQTVWLWPNIDAGSDHVSSAIRTYREKHDANWLRLVKNYPPDVYLKVLANAACVVGNSSSFIRDSSFFGTPVVLVGDRQDGREVAENVVFVDYQADSIARAIRKQLDHGRYAPSQLYGDGKTSARIANTLATAPLYIQKRLDYIQKNSDFAALNQIEVA
jgi:UDP-hydrolysing UDP-N-acetyl-D-glucosamine 2-epimerase